MKKFFLVNAGGLLLLLAAPLQARDVQLSVNTTADAIAAANKANELAKAGDLVGARRYYDLAIRADPKLYLALYSRGEISMHEHKWEAAVQDFDAALAASHSFFIAAIRRGQANERLGRYDRSLADYNTVVNLHPMEGSRALARNARSWLRATCHNPSLRDGRQAVEDGIAACAITSWDNADYIDTLAAAYAEAGNFEEAVKTEQKAISKMHEPASIKGAQQRLALYQQHHPYHE